MVATFKISSKITFSILFIEDSAYTSIFTDIRMMTSLPNLPNGGWGVWTCPPELSHYNSKILMISILNLTINNIQK